MTDHFPSFFRIRSNRPSEQMFLDTFSSGSTPSLRSCKELVSFTLFFLPPQKKTNINFAPDKIIQDPWKRRFQICFLPGFLSFFGVVCLHVSSFRTGGIDSEELGALRFPRGDRCYGPDAFLVIEISTT